MHVTFHLSKPTYCQTYFIANEAQKHIIQLHKSINQIMHCRIRINLLSYLQPQVIDLRKNIIAFWNQTWMTHYPWLASLSLSLSCFNSQPFNQIFSWLSMLNIITGCRSSHKLWIVFTYAFINYLMDLYHIILHSEPLYTQTPSIAEVFIINVYHSLLYKYFHNLPKASNILTIARFQTWDLNFMIMIPLCSGNKPKCFLFIL